MSGAFDAATAMCGGKQRGREAGRDVSYAARVRRNTVDGRAGSGAGVVWVPWCDRRASGLEYDVK